MDLTSLLDETIDWRYKGFPPTDGSVTVGNVAGQNWNALNGDLLPPLLLLKENALAHNIALMARYCREQGLSLAPHGKTPLAPQIARRQLDAGAWGITVANLHQMRIFRAFGASRLLLANELVEPLAFHWLANELDRDPSFDVYVLADSVQSVALAERALQQRPPRRKLPVLVELGVPGGRTGARGLEEAKAVAAAITASSCLALAGVEGYEGAIDAPTLEEKIAAIDSFMRQLRRLTVELSAAGAFAGRSEIVVSAGGSSFFDRVAAILAPAWDLPEPVRVVVRSGSYFTHDVDTYGRLSALAGRATGSERLQPALELWAAILSRPEPGLAIANFGKRDVSYDLHLPFPFALRRGGETRSLQDEIEVTQLNDQHAFLRLAPALDLQVGDLLGCHISHPCTAWDKWRLVPLVDDGYRVTGAIRTFF